MCSQCPAQCLSHGGLNKREWTDERVGGWVDGWMDTTGNKKDHACEVFETRFFNSASLSSVLSSHT